MLHRGQAVLSTRTYPCVTGFVVLMLLTGCAQGMPLGSRSMFEAMRYRPATPKESPDTVAARKRGEREREALKRAMARGCSGPIEGGTPFDQAMQGYNVPGRSPDSQMPWEFFLGNAAHRLIAYMYRVRHPGNRVFFNNKTILEIMREARLGDESKLLPSDQELRPDITDSYQRYVFEIKPWNDQGLQAGRLQLQLYLAALNRPLPMGKPFTGGFDFDGEVLIRFARGQYIWRLEWRTTESGIVQYRWTRSQQRFESERAAYEAMQWVDISEQEMQQYGGWVGQAVEGMVSRREQLATFSGAVGVCIDFIGDIAVGVFSGSLMGGRGIKQPPAQGGGQVIPFPTRPPVPAPPAKVPTASGI